PDPRPETLAADVEQGLQLGLDRPDRQSDSRIAVPALVLHAAVERDDVAVLELAIGRDLPRALGELAAARDPVDDLLVDRDADDRGIAAIAEEAGLAAELLHLRVRGLVELVRGDARLHHVL